MEIRPPIIRAGCWYGNGNNFEAFEHIFLKIPKSVTSLDPVQRNITKMSFPELGRSMNKL